MPGDDIRLIVGLGNPGPNYENTRHNVGFQAVDRFRMESWGGEVADEWHPWSAGTGLHTKAGISSRSVLLAKPQTFMNASGDFVQDFAHYYKIQPSSILIVLDDMDLPLGRMRIRKSGSSGGHKGLESILSRFATQDVPRLRLGIGRRPTKTEGKDYVLDRFGADEKGAVEKMLDDAVKAIWMSCEEGLDAAMNAYNAAQDD